MDVKIYGAKFMYLLFISAYLVIGLKLTCEDILIGHHKKFVDILVFFSYDISHRSTCHCTRYLKYLFEINLSEPGT